MGLGRRRLPAGRLLRRIDAAQLIENRGILQRRDILSDLLAARDCPQQSPHDLAGARLRQVVREADLVGLGDGPQMFSHPGAQLVDERARVASRALPAADNIREDRLALYLVRLADDGSLGDPRVRDERRLDLHRPEPVARDVQHIVDAAHDPEIAVLVSVGAVPRHIEALVEFLPVGGEVARVVAPDGAQHRGPRLLDDEIAAGIGPRDGFPTLVDDVRLYARQWQGARAWLGTRDARERRDEDHAGLRLPPGIHDRAAAAADHPVIPHPGLGIDRLADAAEQTQTGEVVARGYLVAELHQRAD